KKKGSGMYGDLWRFSSNSWSWVGGTNTSNAVGIYGVQGVSNSTNRPGSRYNGVTWTYDNSFYLFGGYGYGINGINVGKIQFDLKCKKILFLLTKSVFFK